MALVTVPASVPLKVVQLMATVPLDLEFAAHSCKISLQIFLQVPFWLAALSFASLGENAAVCVFVLLIPWPAWPGYQSLGENDAN